VAIYPETPEAARAYSHDIDPEKSNARENRRPYMARTAWAWIGIPLEAKVKDSAFLFSTKQPRALRSFSKEGLRARVQHATQVAEIFLRQHRTHVFSLYVYRRFARILRWDRAGIIVTEPINVVTEPQKLLTFIYRYAKLSREAQGYDTSAKLATAKELKILDDYIPVNDDEHRVVADMKRDKTFNPVYKVRMCYTTGHLLLIAWPMLDPMRAY
jgi:hypothetical protein